MIHTFWSGVDAPQSSLTCRVAQPDGLEVAVGGVLEIILGRHGRGGRGGRRGKTLLLSSLDLSCMLLLDAVRLVVGTVAVLAPCKPSVWVLLPYDEGGAIGSVRSLCFLQSLRKETFEAEDLALMVVGEVIKVGHVEDIETSLMK